MGKNKTGKYLLYAIGEIVLVVIGILIALSINNWNIKQIDKKTERVVLQNIREEIQLDILDMNWNLEMHQKAMNNEQKLLKLLTGRTNIELDSIDYSAALGMPFISAINTATYNSLSNNNPDLITNQKLKKTIYRHYNFFYTALTEAENRSPDYKLYSRLMPYYEKYFTISDTTININLSQNNSTDYFEENYERNYLIPKSLDQIRSDDGFKVALSEIIFTRSFIISFYKDALKRIETLSNEIGKELEAK
jgi:hypothetical protein